MTPSIDEKILLQTSVILIFLFYTLDFNYNINSILLLINIPILLLISFLSFFKFNLSKYIKSLLYFWFGVTSVIIFISLNSDIVELYNRIINENISFINFELGAFLQVAIIGLAVFPVIILGIISIFLLPFPSKSQFDNDMFSTLKSLIKLLDSKYSDQQLRIFQSVVIIILQGGFLFLNRYYEILPNIVAISLSYLVIEATVFLRLDPWLIILNFRNIFLKISK